jgi:tetratricopeptide (TPR) repeat protein
MSSYLNEADSDSDGEKGNNAQSQMTDEERESVVTMCVALKTEGNSHFSKGEFEDALGKYTAAVNMLKQSGLPRDSLILLNRSATYLALKRYVPALNDANQGKEYKSRARTISFFLFRSFHFIMSN